MKQTVPVQCQGQDHLISQSRHRKSLKILQGQTQGQGHMSHTLENPNQSTKRDHTRNRLESQGLERGQHQGQPQGHILDLHQGQGHTGKRGQRGRNQNDQVRGPIPDLLDQGHVTEKGQGHTSQEGRENMFRHQILIHPDIDIHRGMETLENFQKHCGMMESQTGCHLKRSLTVTER